MPSQRLAPSLPPVTEGDEEARSGDMSIASACSVDASTCIASDGDRRGERAAVQGEGGAANHMSRNDSVASTESAENRAAVQGESGAAANQMCRDDSAKSTLEPIKMRAAVQGEICGAANQMCRDDSMTSTPRSDTSECRMAYTPNELLQMTEAAWAAPWEDRRPGSQSASPAPLGSKSSSQPLDLQRALSCDRASLSSFILSTPSPARRSGGSGSGSGSGRFSASPGRGSGGIPAQPNASPGLLPPHSPMVLREWEEFLFVNGTSPSPNASFRRSRLGGGGTGDGSGESRSGGGESGSESGFQLDPGPAISGGNGGDDAANRDPALRNIRLPIHKVVRSSWPRYRLRRRDHFGVAMEGVAEGDEEEEDDDELSPSSPAVAGLPGRSQSDVAATGTTGIELAASVAITISSEAAIGAHPSDVARSGALSVSQRLAAAGNSPAANDSRPVSRRLSGQMRLAGGACGKSGIIDGSGAGMRDENRPVADFCDNSDGFVNMAGGMMAGGNVGKLFQLLEHVDKHGDYFRGDVEDPDSTSSLELEDAAMDDEPGFLARTDVARLVTDGTDTQYLPRLNKYFPFGAFTIFLMMQALVAVVKSPSDKRAMTATSLAICFAVSVVCPFIKRTGHTALVPRNSWKWPLAVRVGSTNLFIHADAQTLAHAVTKAIAFIPLGLCNETAAKILFPGLQPYWLLLLQLSTFLLVASLTFFVHDHVPSIRTAARPLEPSLFPMTVDDEEEEDGTPHPHCHCTACTAATDAAAHNNSSAASCACHQQQHHHQCHSFTPHQHPHTCQHHTCLHHTYHSYSHARQCRCHSQGGNSGYCNSSMTGGYSNNSGYSHSVTGSYTHSGMTAPYSNSGMTPGYSHEGRGSSFLGTPCESKSNAALHFNRSGSINSVECTPQLNSAQLSVRSSMELHSSAEIRSTRSSLELQLQSVGGPHSTELLSTDVQRSGQLLSVSGSTPPTNHPSSSSTPRHNVSSAGHTPPPPGSQSAHPLSAHACSPAPDPPISSGSTPGHNVSFAGHTPPAAASQSADPVYAADARSPAPDHPSVSSSGSTPCHNVSFASHTPPRHFGAGSTPPLLRGLPSPPSASDSPFSASVHSFSTPAPDSTATVGYRTASAGFSTVAAGSTPLLLRGLPSPPSGIDSPFSATLSASPPAPAAPFSASSAAAAAAAAAADAAAAAAASAAGAAAAAADGADAAGPLETDGLDGCGGASPGAASDCSSSSSGGSSGGGSDNGTRCGLLCLVRRNSSGGSSCCRGVSNSSSNNNGNGKSSGNGNGSSSKSGRGLEEEAREKRSGDEERREGKGVFLETCQITGEEAEEKRIPSLQVAANKPQITEESRRGASVADSGSRVDNSEDRIERGARAWRLISPPMMVKGGRQKEEGGERL
ncbi:hypothetical protein CLOM_g17245 [Closterium sp. NIES-68]|nr:hypothetical protein CLOM_g17245 [Closterium sp. NIES-68]GJP79303.1 hypothetical protein CLOP_g9550 [Closterium sp. NIES-67]